MQLTFNATFVKERIVKTKSGSEIQFTQWMEETGGIVTLSGSDIRIDCKKIRKMFPYSIKSEVEVSNYDNKLALRMIAPPVISKYLDPAEVPNGAK